MGETHSNMAGESGKESIFAHAEHLALWAAVAVVPLAHSARIGGFEPVVEAKTAVLAALALLFAIARAGRIALGAGSAAAGQSALGWLALGWAVSGAVSLFAHPDPILHFQQSLLLWIFFFWVWLASGVARPETALERALPLAAAAGACVAALALIQAWAPAIAGRWLPYAGRAGDERGGLFSTIGNPEYLGGYLAAILCLSLSLAFSARSRWAKAALGAAAAGEGLAMLMTEARGAWLGAGAGLAAALALRLRAAGEREGEARAIPPRRLAVIAAIAAASIASAVAVLSTPNPLNPRGANLVRRAKELADPRSESVRHRLAIAALGARMIAANPVLGAGPGRFSAEFYAEAERALADDPDSAMADYMALLAGRSPAHAHCDPLEFWIEMGFLGFAGFCALLGWGGALLWSGAQTSPAVRTAAVVCAVLLMESLFSFPLRLPTRGALFWTLFALGAAAAREIALRPSPARPAGERAGTDIAEDSPES